MKGKMKKIIAGIATLAMAAQFAFVVPASAATYTNQTVDLSKFDSNTEYDSNSGVATVTLGYKKWAKLDLSDYTVHGTEKTQKITVSYKDNITLAGRIEVGFFDSSKTKFEATNYENATGAAIHYGVFGNNSKNYGYNGGNKSSATFTTGADEEVSFVFDLQNQKMTGTIGGMTVTEKTITNVDNIDTFAIYSWSNDNIVYKVSNMKITTETSSDTYYKVTYDVEGTETSESVKSGEKVAKLPTNTQKAGYIFNGWIVNGDESNIKQSNEIEAMTIDNNYSFTAKYSVNTAYVHKIKKVEFTEKGSTLTEPSDSTPATKQYTVRVISDADVDITDNEGMNFNWTIVGKEADAQYTGFTSNGKTATLSVVNGVERGYYGYIKVDVAYDPANSSEAEDNSTGSAQIPYAILRNTVTTNIIPKQGYPINFSADDGYADSMVGYVGDARAYTANDNNGVTQDVVLDNWSIYGSNGDRTLTLKKEDGADGDKYLEFASNGGGGSTVGIYRWTSQSEPYIIETTINMPAGASVAMTNKAYNDNTKSVGWEVKMNADSMTVYDYKTSDKEDATISGVKAGEWYKLLIVVNPTTKQYYAKVLNTNGQLVGQSDVVTCADSQTWLNLTNAFPILMKTLRAYNPTITTAQIKGDESIKVPDEGQPAKTMNLTAEFSDADGNLIPAAATWSLTEEKTGVSIDETTGVLSVSNGAAGTVTVRASSGAASITKQIRLVTSANAIEFTGASAITIPFAGEDAAVETYKAQTVGPDSQPIANDEITYTFLKKDGTTEYDTLPTGISFEAATGKLTVTSAASPVVLFIKATNKEGLIERKSINIHGRSYVFGTTEPDEDSGNTLVGAVQYTDVQEYGFETTTGLTANASNVSGTSAFKFKVKVPNGNYRVEIAGELPTGGSIKSEEYTGDATGTTKGLGTSSIAVCDGILDLTFPANSKIESLSVSQITATRRSKPAVFAVGDSTTKNSGHYRAYNDDKTKQANGELTWVDERTYGSWANRVTDEIKGDTFSQFTNKGNAGKNICSYYNLGDIESVLLNVCPGDYVTINMGINPNSSVNFKTMLDTYYVQAVIDRGGIPVMLTHTPDGVGFSNSQSSYNSTTGKFEVARRNNDANKAIMALAEEHKADGSELIDVGLKFENYFNQLHATPEAMNMMNTQNNINTGYETPTEVYGLVTSWFPDHNHYTAELGDKIAKYVFYELTAIATGGERDDVNSGILPFEDDGNYIDTPEPPTPAAPKLAITAQNTSEFVVKVGDTVKANGDELAVGNVITITAADNTKEITSATGFTVANGAATYTVKDGDTTVTISDVVVSAKPSENFAVTFTTAPTINDKTVTITGTVVGTGTKAFDAYIAEYNGTALKAVKKKTITISNTTPTDTISFDTAPTGTVKAFVWDQTTSEPILTNTAVSTQQ